MRFLEIDMASTGTETTGLKGNVTAESQYGTHSSAQSRAAIWTQTRPTVIENYYHWMADSLTVSSYRCEKVCVAWTC